MNKVLRLSREGFTLVELMIVVAIIGILATIAVPQYQKFQSKAKQTEVRLALAAIHTVETSASVDSNSFTACIGSIGYSRDGTKFYYTVGFDDTIAASSTCGPEGATDKSCLNYQWKADMDATTGAVSGFSSGAACTAGANSSVFLANQKDKYTDLPKSTDLAAPIVTAIARDAFTIGAAANLAGTKLDKWTMDQNKNMLNVESGL